MLVAIGVLCQRHLEIQLFQISSKLRNIKSFSLSNVNESDKSAVEFSNTVEDNLILYGSCILSADGCDCFGEKGWDIDEKFIAQINIMWKICCRGIPERFKTVPFKVHSYPNMWNKVTSVLMALDEFLTRRENSNILQIQEKTYIEAATENLHVGVYVLVQPHAITIITADVTNRSSFIDNFLPFICIILEKNYTGFKTVHHIWWHR